MKVSIEQTNIKLRREGIFLCLGGTNSSNLWERFHHFVEAQCKSFDIPLKIGLLSWDRELDEIPDREFLASNNISARGSFITPLVENSFNRLTEKDYDLLILSSQKIYDWEDWQDEISSRFNKVHVPNQAELEQKTQIQLEEELIQSIFDFRIDTVALSLINSLCYDYPDGFKLKIQDGRFILTKHFENRCVDISLKTWGVREKARFVLEACNFKVEDCVENSPPEIVSVTNEFDANSTLVFLDSVQCYKRREFDHYCPLCQSKHAFPKAFMCNRKKSRTRLFATESLIFDQVETKRTQDSRYVVFSFGDEKLRWQVFDKPAMCFDKEEFIVVPDEGRISYIQTSGGFEVFEFLEIHKGLFCYPQRSVYILTLK